MIKIIILSVVAFLILVGIVYSLNSYGHMLKVYRRFDNEFVYCNATGLEFAKFAIKKLNLKTKIMIIDKELGECYIPSKDIVCISQHTANKSSVSSICVTAHELGHAVQNKEKSKLFVLQSSLSIIGKICLFLFPFLTIASIVLFIIPNQYNMAITMLLIAFAMILTVFIFKLVTIPMEKQASKIAYNFLKDNKVLSTDELNHAKKVLDAALGTYIAGLFAPIINLFRAISKMFKR